MKLPEEAEEQAAPYEGKWVLKERRSGHSRYEFIGPDPYSFCSETVPDGLVAAIRRPIKEERDSTWELLRIAVGMNGEAETIPSQQSVWEALDALRSALGRYSMDALREVLAERDRTRALEEERDKLLEALRIAEANQDTLAAVVDMNGPLDRAITRAEAAEAQVGLLREAWQSGNLTIWHESDCPGHPDRVRAKGPCCCGVSEVEHILFDEAVQPEEGE